MPGMWDTVNGVSQKSVFASWPKPFNAVERIDVLHCNEVMMLRAQFVAEIVGEFWFDAFVPSPTELFRNWIFGNLRCGKKMGIPTKMKGPGNLFLSIQGRVMLAEIGGMIGFPLMLWSMGQTIFNAMDTWTTMLNTQAFCEEEEAHGIMRHGSGMMNGEGRGSPVFYTKVYDPHSWGQFTNGFWNAPFGSRMAWAIGTLTNQHPTITAHVSAQVVHSDVDEGAWKDYVIPPGDTVKFSIGKAKVSDDQVSLLFWNRVALGAGFNGCMVVVERFMFTYGVPEDPNNRFLEGPFEPDISPNVTCDNLYPEGAPQ